LGACKPAQEILRDLTTIIEGDMGIDTTQMGWANDVEAFCSALRDRQFIAALDLQGVRVAVGNSKGIPNVTFSVISERG